MRDRATILALLIALLIAAGLASPGRAQAPPAAAAQATQGRVATPGNLAGPQSLAARVQPRIPDFVGHTRREATALAQKNGLQLTFDRPTSDDAHVTGQSLPVGTPISRATPPIQLRMEATPVHHGPDLSEILRPFLSTLAQPPTTVPDFVGHTRGEAIALARQYHLAPAFDRPTGDDAHVTGQFPLAQAPLSSADGRVRLQMEALTPPQQGVPNFVGHTRADAITLAQQFNLTPNFDGPTDDDALVTAQSVPVGTPIPHDGGRIGLRVEAPPQPMPDFVRHTRDEANALAGQSRFEPAFSGATDSNAYVSHQAPGPGGLYAAGTTVRLQMEAPPQPMPDFAGFTRSRASALAQKVGLKPAFEGATGDDAHVGGQAPEPGTPFRAGAPVQLRMEAPPPPPPLPPPPVVAPPPPAAVGPPPAAGVKPIPPLPPMPKFVGHTRDEASAMAQQSGLELAFEGETGRDARVGSQFPVFGTPYPAGTRVQLQMVPPPCAASPTCPGPATRNWLLLAAIAAGLAGGAGWIVYKLLHPPVPITALTTRTVSAGLVGATVSIHAADGPRFEIRYAMTGDARPRPEATRIVMSVKGDENGG